MKKTIIVLLSLALVLSSCATTTTEETPRIGGLFGLTGFASFAGEASRDGFLLAIEDYGKPVDYVIEDYQSDMTATATAARKLIEVDDMQIIIGPEWEFGAVVSPLAEQRQALFITPWLTLDTEWAQPEWFMSAMPKEQLFADETAKHIRGQGIESLVIVRSKDDFALTVDTDIRRALDQKVAVVTITADLDASDYRTEILRLQRANPDAVYVVFASDNAQGRFMRQMAELGVELPVYINQARGESEVFANEFEDEIEGAIYVTLARPEKLDEFSEKFEARYGRPPGAISAATSYDMTTLVLQAWDSGARSPTEVQEYLENLEDYEGYSGTLEFEDGFRASAPTVIKQFQDGKRVIMG